MVLFLLLPGMHFFEFAFFLSFLVGGEALSDVAAEVFFPW
jgi:hypothetical protein